MKGLELGTSAPHASAVVDSGMVVVKLGDQKKRYTLHRKLLTYHSGYFRKRLSSELQNTGVIYLYMEEATIDVFDIFVDWMYEKTLPSRIKDPRLDFVTLQAYVLAEALSVSKMKTALMDDVYAYVGGTYFTVGSTVYLFEHLPENDPMLQLAADKFSVNNGISRTSVDTIATIDRLPKEFLVRVFRKLHQLSKLPEEEKKVEREDYSMVVCMRGTVVDDSESDGSAVS